MKKNFLRMSRLLSLVALVVGGMTLTACGGDDDDDNGGGNVEWGKFETKLSTPAYEKESALYEITSDDTNIQSIELTASGNYIVVTDNYSMAREVEKTTLKKRLLGLAKQMQTRAGVSGIVYGKFTKINDTTFRLEGWGTVTIEGGNSNAVSLKITLEGGTELPTLTAAKKTQMADNEKTTFLCRTWTFYSMRMIIKMPGGDVLYDKEYKMNELKNFGRDMYNLAKQQGYDDWDEDDGDSLEDYMEEWEDDEEGLPVGVIFTKSGTYMPIYTNDQEGELAISTWTWENVDTGVLRYSWNYNDMNDPYASGNVKVGSRGAQLMISENFSNRNSDYDDDDDQYGSATMVYYLNEAK